MEGGGNVLLCSNVKHSQTIHFICGLLYSKLPKRNSLIGWACRQESQDQVARSDEEHWACQICTLINKPSDEKCDACLTPKPKGIVNCRLCSVCSVYIALIFRDQLDTAVPVIQKPAVLSQKAYLLLYPFYKQNF